MVSVFNAAKNPTGCFPRQHTGFSHPFTQLWPMRWARRSWRWGGGEEGLWWGLGVHDLEFQHLSSLCSLWLLTGSERETQFPKMWRSNIWLPRVPRERAPFLSRGPHKPSYHPPSNDSVMQTRESCAAAKNRIHLCAIFPSQQMSHAHNIFILEREKRISEIVRCNYFSEVGCSVVHTVTSCTIQKVST